MEEDDKKINGKRIKRLLKDSMKEDIRLSASGLEFLRDVTTEFVQLISIAGLSKSTRSKQYLDSKGVINALNDLGFPEIAQSLPTFDSFSEDMHQIAEE